MITAKINVSLIDKAKLFKGEKGTYLDIVLFETPDDKYGNDYRICQSVSKEDRAKGVKGAILGNAKKVVKVTRGNVMPKQSKIDDSDVPNW